MPLILIYSCMIFDQNVITCSSDQTTDFSLVTYVELLQSLSLLESQPFFYNQCCQVRGFPVVPQVVAVD